MSPAAITFRLMRAEDAAFALELARLAGWNQCAADWERLLAIEPEGCFVGLLDGVEAGSVTTTSYGTAFGWVGMLLVHPKHRRRGLGTALLQQAVEYLQGAGIDTVRLDATPVGHGVYIQRGFEDESQLERRLAPAAHGRAHDNVRPFVQADFEAVCGLDARCFGADRGRVIDAILQSEGAHGLVASAARGIAGYALVRPGRKAFHIGPVVATTPAAAAALIDNSLHLISEQPALIDFPADNKAATTICQRHGFTAQRPFIRMYRGPRYQAGDGALCYAISGPEKG